MSKSDLFKTTAEIRETFLKYFEKNGHTRVASSSLVPERDPTLLFANAGMNQFKDAFLGLEKRSYSRATSVQKCVRAGGKHNDLENVGFTARHHTFFEMLGNFSFGDYFKKDAIHFAWEFVTKELGLPKEKLRVSVYEDDEESVDIWHRQEGVPLDRIVRFREDNFWQMGDTGPCGPCTEIFWDQGREVDGDRWLEFWNCVFMQYDRSADGTMVPLPAPSVDTGMGLERMAAILQGASSNYDIDLMKDLILSTQAMASKKAGRKIQYDSNLVSTSGGFSESAALRVIVDHLRSTSFLIADGVLPSNEGRGYVLRRILRRAVRFAKRLGVEEPMLHELYPVLEGVMGKAYPALLSRRNVVMDVLREEETRFYETLHKGLELLEDSFSKSAGKTILPAETVFKLYDTFGFPVDLTALIAREKGYSVDEAGFQNLMQQQQEKSRASWKGSGEATLPNQVKEWKNAKIFPKFTGYENVKEESTVLAKAQGTGAFVWVTIDPCPFYPEGGGQVGDQGVLKFAASELRVIDTVKAYEGGGIALLLEKDHDSLKIGTKVMAHVDESRRSQTRANHTATHLLHSALKKVLGEHVSQAGSLVTPDKLRFDFSHPRAISSDDLAQIEILVNQQIEVDRKICVTQMQHEEALKKGAMALFGEKYGAEVRVVEVPGFSMELCGGTHVSNTGEIRTFKIVSEAAVASGTRRIEAITGNGALLFYRQQEQLLLEASEILKVRSDELPKRVEKLVEKNRELEREIHVLKNKLVQGTTSSGDLHKLKYKGASLVLHHLVDADAQMLRQKADNVRKEDSNSIHIVVSSPAILVTLDTKVFPEVHAGNVLKALTTALGGRGGGQAQTAQGQLSDNLEITKIVSWLESQ